MRKSIPILLATLLLCSAAFAQQAEVAYTENFQTYGKNKNPNGWVDTSIGGSAANGLYKTDIDPTQGNKGTNVVFGTRQSSGRPDGNTPRIGTFSHLTTHNFSSSGRFEYSGRFIRTSADTRIGFSFNSSYPQQDKYYMVALWSRPTGGVTMQLHAFGAGTPAGRLDSNLTPEVSKWYRFRIQADDQNDQTQIRARFWLDGAPEPTTWSIEAADASAARLKSGRIGIWSAVKGDFYVDDLAAKSPVDHTAPVVTLWESDKQLDATVITPLNHNAILEAKVLDDISGVATVTMKVDGVAYTPRTPVTVEGLHTVRADATDNVGNTSFLEAKVLVDKTKPVVVFTEGTKTLDPTKLETFQFDPKVGITVTDNVSTFTWAATLDGQPYVPGTPITTDAFHNLRVVATDQALNVTDVTLRILVDKVRPVVVFMEGDKVLDPTRLETFKLDPRVTIKVTDATSVPTSIITLDGQPYVSGTLITSDGFHDLHVVATDQAGNVTDVTQKLLVDKVAPLVVFSANGTTLDPAAGVHEFGANVGIKIDVTDATSRVTSTITLDGETYTSQTPITTDGDHEIRVIAVDEAGNPTDLTLKILVDKEPPSVVFSESGNVLDPTKLAPFARNASIVIAVTDATSDVTSAITLDGQPYESGTVITADGFHDLRVVATDESHNVTDRTLRVLIDKARPTIEVFEQGVLLERDTLHEFKRDAKLDIVVKDTVSTPTYTATLDGNAYATGTLITSEGTHHLVVNATDEAGNSEKLELDVLVDKTLPVIVFSESNVTLDPATLHRFGHDVRVDIAVTDNLPGVTNTAQITSPAGVTTPYTSGALIHADGKHTIAVTATDAAGNTLEKKLDVLIDQTGPVIEFREGDRKLATDAREDFNHLPVITIVVTDGLTTPTHTATIDTNTTFRSGDTVAEGTHTIAVVAKDELGNETPATLRVLVDKTAPVVTLKVGDQPLPQAGAIFNRNIKVTAVIEDISETTTAATLNGHEFDLADTISEEREHDLSVVVTDELHWSTPKTAKFVIDKTAPKITVFESAETQQELLDEKAFAREIKITATAEDLTAYTLSATIDGALYTLGTPYAVDGAHVLVVNGVDAANNHSQPVTLRFYIDRNRPEVTLLESGEPFPVNETFTRDITATITVRSATETTSEAKIDGQLYTLGQPYAAEGRHEIEVTVRNIAGLPSTVKASFTIDKTKPTIRLYANGQPWTADMKFAADVKVTIQAHDNLTAAPKTKILLDEQEIDDGYTVTREDFHKIRATVEDDGHLTNADGPYDFVLDKSKPVVKVTVVVDDVVKPLENGNQFKVTITPEVTITDLTATTFTATLAVNGGAPQRYEKGDPIAADGKYSLVISVKDDLGNETPLAPITFTIDKTAPVVIVKEHDAVFTGGKFDRNLTPILIIEDLTDTTPTATLDGEQWSSGTEISEDGDHVLNITVTDALGNSFVVPEIAFTIDKAGPVISITERGDELRDGRFFDRDALPKITVTDTTATTYAATLNDVEYRSETLVTEERKHTLKVSATDALQHTTNADPVTFWVDKTPPILTLTEGGRALEDNALLNHDVKPDLAIVELTPYTTDVKLDGTPFTLGNTITTEGPHVLDIVVTDSVQRKATIPNLRFVIDKTAPVVKITVAGKDLKSGDEFGAAITPDFVIDDRSTTTIAATLNGIEYIDGTPITADGNYVLAGSVTDKAGWVTPIAPISFAIDTTAPVVKVTEAGADFVSGKFNRDVAPKITVTDLTATTIDAKLDGNAYTLDSVISTEGTHTFTVTVTDHLGHPTIVPPVSFLLDKTRPVVSVLANGAELKTGDAFRNSVKPEIRVQDVSQTAVDAKLASAAGEQPFVSGLEITAEGEYTLSGTVTDELAWSTPIAPITFYVDSTAPVVTLLDQHDEPLENDTWYAEPVKPKLTIVDTTPTSVTATLNGQPFELGTTITAEGKYTLAITVTDKVGLPTIVPPVTFTIDTTAPVITFLSPAANAVLTSREIVVTGDSGDAVSVFINGAKATIDESEKKYVSPPLDLLEGENILAAVAYDRAGNKAEPFITVTLDSRGPELAITAPLADACLNVTQIEVKGSVFGGVSTIAVKAGSGASVNATIDATARTWSASVPAPAEGKLQLVVTGTDASGHTTIATRNVTVDRTKPVVEVLEGNAPFSAPLVNRPVALTVRSLEADVTFTVTLNGAPYTNGTPVANEGAYTLEAKATDCAGNVSDVKTVAFRIDRTPPQLTNFSPANGASIGSKPAAITGSVNEPASIVAEGTNLAATVTGNAFSIATTLVEGPNAFVFVATDAAGNQSRWPYSVNIQTEAPAVDIVENGAPITADALFRRDVTPVIRSSNPAATITATHNGAPFTSGTAITSDGTHTIVAKATDSFGHESNPATATFRIDKTPPSISITAPQNGATLPSATVTVSGTVSADARSVTVNGVAASVTNGAFTASITLDGVDGLITATAVDEAGNLAVDRVDVTFAGGGALAILLTSPADKLVTNRPQTVVAGQIITPADAESLTVNGAAVAFDAVGLFLVPDFALREGENPITATVKKSGGASNSVTVVVTADFTPPLLKVLANSVELASGARFTTSPAIVVEATDNNPGVTTKLTIDGTTITGSVPPLKDGGHALTAIARDAAGNEARVDRTFFIGIATAVSGCGLSNIDPADQSGTEKAIYASSVQINGRSGGAAAVLINGVRAEVSEGSFCGMATLAEGRNEISIQCANADGTPTTDAPLKVVYYRYLDPVITLASLDAVVYDAKITVSGTVGAGVLQGSVNGINFTVPDDGAATHNFSVPNVTLTPGVNVVSARARTLSGRGGIATARVKLLSGTPQIAITSPLGGSSTGSTSVGVSGTYSNVNPSTITVTAGNASVAANVTALTDTTGTFQLASVNLPAGAKTTITVNGRNAAGVLATASIEVEQVATAPQISITSPADNTFLPSTSTGAIHVTGTINDVPNASVQVNGTAATLTGTTFSADVDATGATTPIIARVILPDGRSATDAARVIRFASAFSVRDAFPSNNATDVDAAVVILATASNPIDGATVASAFKVLDAANNPVPGDLYVDRDTISFAPHAALHHGERYTISIAQSLKDAAGASPAAAFTSSFTVAGTAPNTPPVLDPIADGCFTDAVIRGRVSVPGARVQLIVDGVENTKVSNATTGTFEVRMTFSGQPGFHSVRAREMGSDGTFSPERAVCVRISCAAPRVVAASLDRAAKKLVIEFSKPMDATSLTVGANGSIRIMPDGASALSGTLAINATKDTATITFAEALPQSAIALTVTRAAKDESGALLAAEYTQLFTAGGEPPSASGKGYISGAVYDATRGRQLSGATIRIAGEPPSLTNEQGRYASRPLPEGAYTIEASAPNRTTVWRQVVVPVGAGVLPIDIRLTERGPEVTADGTAKSLTHGGDTTVTKPIELTLTAASLTTGRKVRLTSVGAQSLAGLLPLGWSPLAAAEIVVDDETDPQPMPGAKLTFSINRDAVTNATQKLSVVQYDSERDEWRVAVAAANVASDGKVVVDLTASGNYALVYPDQATHLTKAPVARAGAVLTGVLNPCLTTPEVCLLEKIDFVLNPQAVLPNGRSTATLTTKGAGTTQTYPSGTAVQAYIDEELNLADGRVLIDPPFATDLLVYRDLAGTTGVADFHLAPTPQAAAAMLRDGADHIRVVDYPGRIDRGTLIGADGGRVPGDDAVTIDIPSGATMEPLHAGVSSLTSSELASYGAIAGFRIAGGFHFTLTPTSEPEPVDGVNLLPTQLIKPARATFSVAPIPTAQVIVAEVISDSPFGVQFRMVSATTASTSVDVPGSKVYTTRASGAGVPLTGLVREGRYLILAANAPIAYAYGQVRGGDANGLALANARVTSGIGSPMTAPLGVTELTRTGGVFVVPVAATPAPAYSLQPRSVATGDGSVAVASAAPAADTFTDFGALVLSAQQPQLMSLSPDGSVEVDPAVPFTPQAVFNVAIDASSVENGLVIRNLENGQRLTGTMSASGATVRFTPSQTLSAATQYSITVAPTIRTLTGTPFGRTVTKQFRTRARITNANIRSELIAITIPDANGKATIHGRAGALPTGSQAIAVRRGRNFIVSYDTTVTNPDGSFSFDAGHEDPKDRITIDDDIDLRVIDAISRAVIADIPLTFASLDGRTLVAVPDKPVAITSEDGITITIEAGTFDVRTTVTLTKQEKAVFTKVPKFDEELGFSGAVEVKFDGVAKKRMQIEMPAPAGASTSTSYFLGYLGQSIRGPRVELADTLRLVDGKFTTTLASASSARSVSNLASTSSRGISAQQIISNPADVKRYFIGVLRSGIYATVNLNTSVGWGLVSGVTSGVDLFWDSFASLFASQFTLTETRGSALIPVAPNKQFLVVGVDASTGLEQFRKVYDGIGAGDPLTAVVVPAPDDERVGPYPVFAAPARFEVVDTAPPDTTIESVRGLEVKVVGNNIRVKRTEEPGLLEVVNVNNTSLVSDDVALNADLAITGSKHDRVLISMMAKYVDAFAPVSITFHQPLYVGPSTAPDDVDAYFHTNNLIRVEAGDTLATLAEVTGTVEFSLDSQNRRVLIDVQGALQLDRTYRITISKNLRGVNPDGTPGLRLAQKSSPSTVAGGSPVIGPQLPDDMHLYFETRAPGGQVAEMNLTSGVVRDLGINGNIGLVATLTGGIQAFDISDPAALQGTPTPIGKTQLGEDEMWGISSDRHGRIYATGLEGMFGFVRTYRIEDFIPDAPGAPKIVHNDQVISTALASWRVGASAGLPLSTSYLTVSDRPEAIPRKIQVLLQDDEKKIDLGPLVAPPGTTPPSTLGDFYQLSTSFSADPATKYRLQRVTIENRTAGLHWSKDVKLGGGSATINFLARASDDVYIVRNQMTYGVVSLFGYGVGVFDLNAMESNDTAGSGPAFTEKVALTDAKPCQPNPYVPCMASDYEPKCPTPADAGIAPFGVPCPIREINLTPESLISTGPDSSSINVYALDSYRGILDLTIEPPKTNPAPPSAVIPAEVIRHPGLALGRSRATQQSYHQLLLALRQLYLTATGREPSPRFQSIAPYLSFDEDGNKRDYALVTGRDFGLLVVKLDGAPLTSDHLVDVVWIPAGAVAVRVIPRTDIAVVVDGAGRVLFVNLKQIDESDEVAALPACSSTCPAGEMFPTAWAAATATTPGLPAGADWFELGVDDPRIIWKSAPKTVLGTLAPVIDAETGILFTGDVQSTRMRAIAATDPHPRVMVNTGDPAGYRETGAIVPLGIDPPSTVTLSGPDASLGVFRVEVTLPGSITESLVAAGNELRFAIESERSMHAVTRQTPDPFPVAHLRRSLANGDGELRAAPAQFHLSRLIPYDATNPALYKLRFQRGYNRFVSPWVVALADPRASSKYKWSNWGINATNDAAKREHGCFSCTKPAWITGTEGVDYFEIYSAGRYFAIRPEVCRAGDSGCVLGNEYFATTAYKYLGEGDRLVTRVGTVMADSIRPTYVTTAAQSAPAAGGALQEAIFTHSGELLTSNVDHDAGGRAGWNVIFDRTYRSRTIGFSPLARGWDSSIFQRLRELPNRQIEYRDGTGEVWVFRPNGGGYDPPVGLYLKLTRTAEGWRLIDQKFRITEFDSLGRMVRQTDEFFTNSGGGNVIRYFYDRDDHLVSIIDPVNRATGLYWTNDRLDKIKDWRDREASYHYDAQGRLEHVELPKAMNPAYPAYDYSFASTIRKQFFTYGSPAATPSADYSDAVELDANLVTIKEPGDSGPRVEYEYHTGTKRDMVHFETWKTSDNPKATFDYTMLSGTFPSVSKATVTDARKQVREYSFANALQPKNYTADRAHATQIDELAVPRWKFATFGTLPVSVSKNDTGTEPETRVFKFGFTEGRLTSSSLDGVSSTTYGYDGPLTNNDYVLTSRSVSGSAGAAGLAQTYERDGTFLKAVVSGGLRIDAPEPNKDALTITEEDGGVRRVTKFYPNGLPEDSRATAFEPPASGAGDYAKFVYYPDDDPEKHRRGLVQRTDIGEAGSTITSLTNYAFADTESQSILGRSYTRHTQYDEIGRVLNVSVSGTDVSTKDEYAYDARGRIARHRSKQKDAPPTWVEDRYEYDLAGRMTAHDVWQQNVTTGPSEFRLSRTEYDYDYPNGQVRTTLPEDGEITRKLDGLGRETEVASDPRNSTFASTIRQNFAYDLDGNLVFSTDGAAAVATKFDAVHRPVALVRSDSTSATQEWDGWVRLTKHEEDDTNFVLTNEYTQGGKQIRSETNSLVQKFEWDGAGRTRKVSSNGGPTTPARESQLTYDSAGRLQSSRFGHNLGVSGGRVYHHLEWVYGSTDQPSQVTSYEDNDAHSYTWMLTHDALGRTTRVANQTTPDFFVKQTFDQLGNVTSLKSPERRGEMSYEHDGRGLPTEEKLPAVPGGAADPKNKIEYDDNGVLKKYTDATGEPTDVLNDGLGRPLRRTYKDNSTEEIYYTGTRINRFKDRQNRWQNFEYDGTGRLWRVTNGTTLLDELTYHSDGRLLRWKNAESVMEFNNYDADGRPHLTTQTRLRPDGTTIDSFTQTHEYDGFGQRTSWTMPGTFGTANWTTAIYPTYDVAGNVITLQRALVNGGMQTLMSADYRAAGRPKYRTLSTNIGTPTPVELKRTYEYGTDGIGRMSAFRVTSSTSTSFAPLLLAGSEVQYEGTKLTSARLLGLSNGERTTQWRYDERGRLAQSLPASTEEVTVGPDLADAIIQHVNDADFLKKIEKTAPGTAPTDDKEFDESDGGHKVEKINNTEEVKYKTADNQDNGSLRTEDGRFLYVYDEKARLRRAILKPVSGAVSVTQVTYDYNAAGRMIGRRVQIANYNNQPLPDLPAAPLSWALATPVQLGPDAVLPAHTTFVWDPISDQLLSVVDAESGKTLRQYIHGGMGMDDPIEVAVDEAAGVTRYYPIYDEAGDGGLQTVLTADAKIVARTIIEDPYGDGELAIPGPAVDSVKIGATKASDGSISEIQVEVRMTEPVDPSALNDGGVLAIVDANGDPVAAITQTPSLQGSDYILRWTIPGATWTSLTATPGAFALSIAITNSLRSTTFGSEVPILEGDTSNSSIFIEDHPFEWREPLPLISGRFATLASGSTATTELYVLSSFASATPTLAPLAGRSRRIRSLADTNPESADSASALLLTAVFQAQPFSDPFTLKNYVRARWYDPATGTWLGPDPLGYVDSSNLYSFAGGDPVNYRDPRGEGMGEWLSKKYHNAADKIDSTVAEIHEGLEDDQWFSKSAADVMQLASGFLRQGDEFGTDLGNAQSARDFGMAVSKQAYNILPMEEARALIQEWDRLDDAERARYMAMGVSKAASTLAMAKGLQQTASAAVRPTPATGPRFKVNLIREKPVVRAPVAQLTTAGAIEIEAPLVKYDGEFAARQILGEEPVTPKGRQIMRHAAERMKEPPNSSRVPMTKEEIDAVLDKGDKIKKIDMNHPKGPTVTVQSTTMPGKPQVAVDADTGNRVVTVVKSAGKKK